jgi:hypothetical protein
MCTMDSPTAAELHFSLPKRVHPHLSFPASRPADVTPDLFLKRVGGGCESLAEKFPGDLHEILESNGQKLKKMGVSVKQVRSFKTLRRLQHGGSSISGH